jgi:Holliday junction DNA helicase RuvA
VASTFGPRFALQVSAPADWNLPQALPETQVAVRSETGEGWLFEVHSPTFREQLLTGEPRWVYLAQILRDDAEILYAFESPAERAVFMELCDLDSVGPKTAAQILSNLGMEDLFLLVNGAYPNALKIPGVGPKTLEKLKVGLKVGKERFVRVLGPARIASGGTRLPRIARGGTSETQDVGEYPTLVETMERLGLKPADTLRLCREIEGERGDFPALAPGEQVKLVLQRWGRLSGRASTVNN